MAWCDEIEIDGYSLVRWGPTWKDYGIISCISRQPSGKNSLEWQRHANRLNNFIQFRDKSHIQSYQKISWTLQLICHENQGWANSISPNYLRRYYWRIHRQCLRIWHSFIEGYIQTNCRGKGELDSVIW